ncbi:MAG: GNAT family N-acetyltransferase [Ruminococcus sp.]|jgi:GNAT superfamily N-acetyltransferase|nr:GNAT family N-acetyltransferase [Ruminococcus sp.]
MNIIKADKTYINVLTDFRLEYLSVGHALSEAEREAFSAQIRGYFERNLGSVCECFLAEEGGSFTAVIFLIKCEKPANFAFSNGKTAMLMNVYTKPEYRKRGIASRLLDAVIDYAKSQEITCIDLSATVMGQPLYLKHGFKMRGNGNSEMRLKL